MYKACLVSLAFGLLALVTPATAGARLFYCLDYVPDGQVNTTLVLAPSGTYINCIIGGRGRWWLDWINTEPGRICLHEPANIEVDTGCSFGNDQHGVEAFSVDGTYGYHQPGIDMWMHITVIGGVDGPVTTLYDQTLSFFGSDMNMFSLCQGSPFNCPGTQSSRIEWQGPGSTDIAIIYQPKGPVVTADSDGEIEVIFVDGNGNRVDGPGLGLVKQDL